MAKECAITKKSSQMGGGYANRTRATVFTPIPVVRKYANLQKKKVFVPELNKSITITVSTKGLRTIQKNGAYNTLKKAGLIK
jgi:large subunit ribosomal protein L28